MAICPKDRSKPFEEPELADTVLKFAGVKDYSYFSEIKAKLIPLLFSDTNLYICILVT